MFKKKGTLLILLGVLALILPVLAACAPAAAPTPTATAKPAAPAPTTAPAVTPTPAAPAAAKATAMISVNPTVVDQGKTLVISGVGFTPKQVVLMTLVGALKGEDVLLAGTEVNENGGFSSPVIKSQQAQMAAIPAAVPPGTYSVKAADTKGVTAITPLTVKLPPTPTPKPAPTPTPAPK